MAEPCETSYKLVDLTLWNTTDYDRMCANSCPCGTGESACWCGDFEVEEQLEQVVCVLNVLKRAKSKIGGTAIVTKSEVSSHFTDDGIEYIEAAIEKPGACTSALLRTKKLFSIIIQNLDQLFEILVERNCISEVQ